MTRLARRSGAARRGGRTVAKLAAIAAIAALTVSATSAAAQAFSTAPLAEKAAFPEDGLPAAPVAFVGWLRTNAASVTEGQAAMLREHLYAILSADARRRFAATGATLPARDSVLAALYDLADRMGLPGGALVAASLFPVPKPTAPVAAVDSAFSLGFGHGMFTLAARDRGWRVRFPHYFMLARVQRERLAGGVETDVVVLSTLFAANAPAIGGASQASIMLLSSPNPDDAEFVATWMARLGFAPTLAPAESPLPGAPAYYTRDAAMHLRKNLVILRLRRTTLVAAFIGLDGTYEANRPHFVDVLTSLDVSSGGRRAGAGSP